MINLESLTEKDCNKYLESGSLTEPFLDVEFVILKIQKDKETYPDASIIESLMRWINYTVPFTQDIELKNKHKFKRTAKEIWEDGFCNACKAVKYSNYIITHSRNVLGAKMQEW